VFRLAQALLFSLLYGAEFLVSVEDVRRFETAWWKGVRQFYGLPNGVSNVTLALLFPEFSLVHKVLLGKLGLMLRGLRSLPTLLPEALVYDRGYLFSRHKVGFTAVMQSWGVELGLDNFHLVADRSEGANLLREVRGRHLDSNWETFSRMPSTREFAGFLGSRVALRAIAVEASRRSRLGLRVLLLAGTGSLAQSYLNTRFCPVCLLKYDFVHFISCPALGEDLSASLLRFVGDEDWRSFSDLILSRFRVFIQFFRQGHYDADEQDLFECLDVDVEAD
jgi:hypothetical protein